MLFKDLDIIEPIQKALEEAGYSKPTPIQEQSIPAILEGKDLLGCAQTGTGKTAAFSIPVLQNLHKGINKNAKGIRPISALVLAPTRELAIQIAENVIAYSKHMDIKSAVIFGGVNQRPQERVLRAGVDVLIATPGRLLDLMNQGFINLKDVQFFVLDEADRMLDMGMFQDVKKVIAKLPKQRQNLLFSATMPSEVTKLVNSILKNPIKVEVAPVSSTVDKITQGVYFVEKKQKKSLLVHLLNDETIKSALVFSRTKHGANNIVKELDKAGIDSLAIHGNKSQNARQIALNSFKEGKIRVLVATDIAARGIDVDELSHVFNYDLPDVPETYVHRIGRTGRAGNSGIALSFCDVEERSDLRAIEKTIGKGIPVMDAGDFPIIISKAVAQVDKKETDKKDDSKKKPKRNWHSDRKKKSGSGSDSKNQQGNNGQKKKAYGASRQTKKVNN